MPIESLLLEVKNIFYSNPIAQTIGFIALILNALSFISTKDRNFLLFMAISSGVRGIHFFLMGLIPAMVVAFLDIGKNLIALKYPKHHYFFRWLMIIYTIAGTLTFDSENLISLLPAFNALLTIIFIFYLRGKWLKIGFLFILILFFSYNYYVKSLWGIISWGLRLMSAVYGLWKLFLSPWEEAKKDWP